MQDRFAKYLITMCFNHQHLEALFKFEISKVRVDDPQGKIRRGYCGPLHKSSELKTRLKILSEFLERRGISIKGTRKNRFKALLDQ